MFELDANERKVIEELFEAGQQLASVLQALKPITPPPHTNTRRSMELRLFVYLSILCMHTCWHFR